MIPRPRSVTIVGWILILMGIISVINILRFINHPGYQAAMARMMEASPLPASVQYGMMYGSIALTFICGIMIMDGMNSGRWLYVLKTLILTAITLATTQFSTIMIPGLVVFVILATFLFLPKADEFFKSKKAP